MRRRDKEIQSRGEIDAIIRVWQVLIDSLTGKRAEEKAT
jgi:hypothetical protein